MGDPSGSAGWGERLTPGDLGARPERRRGAALDPGVLVGSTDAEILRGFLDLVRATRRGRQRRTLQLRQSDVVALVSILGTDSAEIERRLVAATACSPRLARRGRRLLHASAGLLVVGLLAAPQVGGDRAAAGHALVESGPAVAAVASVPSPASPGSPDQLDRAGSVGWPGASRATVAATIPAAAPSAPQADGTLGAPVDDVPAPPAGPRIPVGAAGAEAVVAIDSVGIELPVVPGDQSVIDQGLVAHYAAPGWEAPVPAGAPGTYWLAAHATTHGAPFGSLPDVTVGAEIRLDAGGRTFVYTVTSTQVTGLYPGDDAMYGTDPTASVILLQTCIDSSRRLLVHGTLTATR